MKAIDTRGNFDEEIKDCLKIPKEKLKNVCKIYESDSCCRYTMMNQIGFFCAKNTKLKKMLDDMVKLNQMKAKGDNCNGLKGD